ncbi:HAMP domain-containing sensor histidine kinase [Pseudoalteromonas sp. Of7M-16]|uniref:sensor histidine kinase n=1 Tax=Pseudoalteromonas sp. Of7M-16 TaxID=2917756 RepID=UPI001EF4B432|nr:HAMP domain-containing sensor histidine kinase [Pseudoalteromonas sp. Of7M-16]MCG7550470.1 HAMP domain-containing histidine kinase [Pseudoalteromonas sp. Of7M-16]
MKLDNSTSGILIRTYLFGAILLVIFYAVIFYFGTSLTEDNNSMKRLAIVGEHYIIKYKDAEPKSIKINPLLTVYTDYSVLPESLQKNITKDWFGSSTFHIEHLDVEFNVLGKLIRHGEGQRVMYAVEDIDAIELEDEEVIILTATVFGGGVVLLILASAYVINSARRISKPVTELAKKLKDDEDFEPIKVDGKLSDEMLQMEEAMNTYRAKVAHAFDREKSFTRYASHELRTPMMVIKGSASILNKSTDEKVLKQVGLLRESIEEMESLVQTFLFLARDQVESDMVLIDNKLLEGMSDKFNSLKDSNNVDLNITLLEPFELNACHQLFSAALGNLIKNALNCTVGGTVNIFVSKREIKVIDNGVGLSSKPRNDEGFGVGLKIVNDICNKYQWQFSLTNNVNKGCTASVKFREANSC